MPLTSLLTSFFGYLHFLKILHLTQLLIDTFTAKLRVLPIACLEAHFVSSQRSNPPEKSKTWDSSHLRCFFFGGGWWVVVVVVGQYDSMCQQSQLIILFEQLPSLSHREWREGERSAITELFLWIKGVNSYCKQVSF